MDQSNTANAAKTTITLPGAAQGLFDNGKAALKELCDNGIALAGKALQHVAGEVPDALTTAEQKAAQFVIDQVPSQYQSDVATAISAIVTDPETKFNEEVEGATANGLTAALAWMASLQRTIDVHLT